MDANTHQPKFLQKGVLLLAAPFMQDPNFKRSVVLLTEHSESGSVGFIVNKPTILTLNEALKDFPPFEAKVFVGGPVQPETLHFIHRSPKLKQETMPIGPGIWWGGNYEELKFLAEAGEIKPEEVRFFLGYSGWSENQLAEEIKKKSWILSNSKPDFTFTTDTESLWKEVLNSMGKKFGRIANYPESPELN